MSGTFSDDQLARILEAVEVIEDSLGRLAEVRTTINRETYKKDRDMQAIVERRFVQMTEAAIDIGTVLIVQKRGEPPETNPETMRNLADIGVLADELASDMVDAARFQNVLAHTYGRSINHDLVYDALTDLERYRDFVVEVRDYLDETGALDDGE
jgi:uncharacterized protein YutE (UPF0331/DUF86 family)